MSVLPATKRSMRIIALPLTTRTADTSTPGPFTYYHFVTPPKQEKGSEWMHWATTKATDIWAGFGKAPEGHWKRRTFVFGERLVDRMDFEELALKSLDPSLGPSLSRLGQSKADVKLEDNPKIPLIYPNTITPSPLAHLRALLAKRTPRHRRGFYMWMILAPFTAPFMIVPIIPNLPFFFCVWRSWSHYRAYKASSYLEEVLEKGAIIPQPSADLDTIYTKYASPEPSEEAKGSKPEDQPKTEDTDSDASATPDAEATADVESQLLLTRDAVPAMVSLFGLQPHSSFATDVYRALEQARLRLERAAKKSK